MLEGRATYPMLRGRRARRHPLRALRRFAGTWTARGLLALLTLVALGWAVQRVREAASRPDAATAMAEGEGALVRANYSAARNHFIDAVADEPTNGRAQAALGRVYVLLGEGVAAQGALDRAAASGVPEGDLHAARAAAILLQGDEDGAIAEAARATGRDRLAAQRVTARALAAKDDRPSALRLLGQVVAAAPRDGAAWSDLGHVLLDNGDVAGANAAAQRALAIDSANLDALVLRGRIVRSQYGLIAALPWFEAALKRDAYYHPALIDYAGTLGDAGHHAQSLAIARRALAARPGSPEALYLMAVIAARAGDTALAGQLLDRTGGALDGLPGGLLLSGGIDYAEARFQQAAVKWGALVATQPMNLTARRLAGAALLASGDAAATLAMLRPIALRADADSYTLALVARAFEAQGQRVVAARYLDRAARPVPAAAVPFGQDEGAAVLADAVHDRPDDPGAAVDYIRKLIDDGALDEAEARARAIVAASPGAPAAQLLLGDVLAVRRRGDAAARRYAAAADLRFDRATMLRLVEARVAAGERTGAGDALALYLAQNPTDTAARRMLATLQSAAGDDRAAVETLEALRGEVGGRDMLLLVQLARAYGGAGDPRAALPLARAAATLQPGSAAAADAWGWALFLAGDTARALPLLDKAQRTAPEDAGIRWHMAQALADAGRIGAARDAIAAALRDPAFADRAAAERLLARLPAG